MIEAVVTHHRSGFRSGVARFNELLAERLDVPLYGLDEDGPGWSRSLLSFKVSELDVAARALLAQRLEGWDGELFLHELSGLELEHELVGRARRVHCGNLEIHAAVQELNGNAVDAWAPGLIVDRREFEPADVTVFSFGMAHKIRTDMFRRLRDLLDALGRPYAVYVSAANHETSTLDDAREIFEQMHELFPSLYFLGNLSDVAVYNHLRRSTFFAAFFDSGVRANNTSVAAAMETGAVVITNLDELSPPEYVHLENLIDLERCSELPTDPAVLDGIRSRAVETAAARGWDQLVERMLRGGTHGSPTDPLLRSPAALASPADGGRLLAAPAQVGRGDESDLEGHPVGERAARIAAVSFDYAAHEKEAVNACNLCGSADLATLAERDRYGYPATLLMCRRCGLGFLSPRLTAAEYGRFYEDVYRPLVSAYHGRLIDAETVQIDQHAYAQELVGFLREHLQAAPASVLDVGGSTGIVAAAVRDVFGSEATVLDPAPDELEVAAAAGMETIAGFAEDYESDERRWDLVLLCQTIDHLLDVRATLESMGRMTAGDGHAFVDVLDLLIAARKQGAVEGAAKIDHPYYLTHGTATAFFLKTGYEPVADRLSDDGHWGFLLRPAEPREPDWEALGRHAAAMIEELSA